jgi:hypothetical protein
LTGRIEAIDAKPDGALTDTGAILTGVRDGRAVSLSISGNSILSDSKQVSATLDGDKPTVTAPGDAGPLVLLKSDMATFLKDATALRARASNLAQQSRSRELQAAQDRAKQNARLAEVEREADQQRAVQDERLAEADRATAQRRRLANDIADLTAAIDAMQPRAARIAKRAESVSNGYDRATQEMARLLTRQTSLANRDRYSALRGQSGVAISQQAFQTDRVHSEVELGSSQR